MIIPYPPHLMKISSMNLHQLKIVQFAFYACRHFTQEEDTSYVVGKSYAVDAFMHPFMITMVTRLKRNVPFAEV